MFKRKDEDIDLLSETNNMGSNSENSEPKMSAAPITPATTSPTAMATPATATPATATPAATPSAVATPATGGAGGYTRPTGFRPANEATRPAASRHNPASSTSSMSMEKPSKPSTSGRRVLTVGHDILLKGEIATCDRLVIEGEVDATLNEVHTVEIAETGSFKGAAEIEDAEISGKFNGELIVRGRLVIYGTGKVSGKITYGEIEIERGGELTGTIKSYDASAQAKKTAKSTKSEKEKVAA